MQTILFDPADHLSFWPRAFDDTKTGLVGGSLNVANIGSFSRSQNKGFELLAYVIFILFCGITLFLFDFYINFYMSLE